MGQASRGVVNLVDLEDVRVGSVLLVIYNRPEITARTIEQLKKTSPSRLYVSADGPKSSEDEKQCDRTRDLIKDLEWSCPVYRLYRDKNIGLVENMRESITWALKNSEDIIVIEDDCLVETTFFKFASKMLEVFRDCEQIAAVCAQSPYEDRKHKESSQTLRFALAKFMPCWGWATWRRAWDEFDHEMVSWPSLKRSRKWHELHQCILERWYWEDIMNGVKSDKIKSWAYRWQLSLWANNRVAAIPSMNLTKNIGFGAEATNTKWDPQRLGAAKVGSFSRLELQQPNTRNRRVEYDYFRRFHYNRYLMARLIVKRLVLCALMRTKR